MSKNNTSRIIELNEDLIQNNQILAQKNLKTFRTSGIKSFDIVGAIGAGKTALLEAITKKLDITVLLPK